MALKDLFDVSKKELKSMGKTVKKIEALADSYTELTDDELKAKTDLFKERLKSGETLDDILVEAFATVREASKRVLGLYPFPVQLLGGISLHNGNISEMKTGEGKSNPIDTPLPTPNGWKTVGDIKLGDYLFDRLGNPTEVIGVYPQGKKDTYEITLKDGRKIKCNSEHLWTVYNKYNRQNPITLTTQQMLDKGIKLDRGYRFHLPMASEVEYEEQKFKIPPYIMGMFLGNGCKNVNNNFELSTSDLDVIEYIAKEFDVIPFKKNKKNYSWNFHKKTNSNVNSCLKIRDIDDKFETLLSDTYCGNKYIPDDYKISSIEQRWELLQGLMDSEGNIHKESDGKRYNIQFSTTSKQLMDDFMEVVYSLGLSCTGKTGKTPEKDGVKNTQYVIRINVPHEVKPKFFKIARKKDVAIEASKQEPRKKDYSRIAIVDIKKLEEETEQVCFTVNNEEHLFLIGNYIVTHNTLTSTMPVYLNALTGKGVHVVTVNEYLSTRDAVDMGELYNWLGLTIGSNKSQIPTYEKRDAYAADITYTTNNELGFDYLKDNMITNVNDRVQRGLNFAVIDEVDSVLIDEARTPLIISGQVGSSSFKFIKIDRLIKTLTDEDYGKDIPSNTVYLTSEGITKLESKLGLDNLYSADNAEVIHYIDCALKANFTMFKDKDYVVAEDKVKIVDSFTGRVMEGRRFSDGLHQALEAKEEVPIEKETKTIASITFQNLFRLYSKLSGMTGTAKTEEEEFREIYNMQVIPIPTNKPIKREDNIDLLYPTLATKYKAVVRDITSCYSKGQPVLVGTGSVEISELISKMLEEETIPHEVLNAKNHAREADIILNAGQLKSVTIATNMAGRGTDIKLGAGVKDVGGLHVIGTERAESRRIDNQLRGRAGRQGDIGSSQFYLSLQDDLMVRFGGDKIKMILDRFKIAEEDAVIKSKTMMKQVESAQKRVEGNNYDTRKSVLEYDDTMSEQRRIIYEQRNATLEKEDAMEEIVFPMIERSIVRVVESYLQGTKKNQWNIEALLDFVVENEWLDSEKPIPNLTNMDKDVVIGTLIDLILEKYKSKRSQAPNVSVHKIEQYTVLQVVDNHWTIHIDAIAQLKEGVQLRGYAQENPKDVYQTEAFDMYNTMLESIEDTVTQILLKTRILTQDNFRSL